MKAVILAGGLGTRITEETQIKPKPMVEIGGRPVLWHIMKIYSYYGIKDFIVCLGYKGYTIKEYFTNYYLHQSDVTFDLGRNSLEIHSSTSEDWRVTLIETGENSQTGGRLKRVQHYVGHESFCFTYGDGLADVNISKLIAFHKAQKTFATLTAVQPPGRFGSIELHENKISQFQEKPPGDGSWISGGFFVLEPQAFDFIGDGDETIWERGPMESLAQIGQLSAFRHTGFWQPMDTLRDKMKLEELWASGNAPWKVWA